MDARALNVQLSAQEISARRADWVAPKPHYTTGVMAKYAGTVSQADDGAVTIIKSSL
ncbi:MAG: dihydroxy-acid dehydratase [Taibaiella sp.]|nr:dihydroxy-acid dehydratase [Taibaiella sp.]